jgi:hypothetical protein
MSRILILLLMTSCASAQFMPFAFWRSAAAPPSFAPPDIDSLYMWAQADSIAGKSHGDTVAVWPNNWAAGNLFNVAATRPTYRTAEIGGKPVLWFNNAATEFMQSRNNALGYKTGLSVFVVAKYKNTDDKQALLAASSGGYSSFETWFVFRPLSGQREWRVNLKWSNSVANIATPDTMPHVWVGLWAASDSAIQWIDGTRSGVSSTLTFLDLRAEIDVAMTDNTGTPITHANVYIAEIIIYGGRVTNAQAQQVREYLATKYGISL